MRFIILVFIIMFVISFFFEDSDTPIEPVLQDFATYGQKGVLNTWPPFSQKQDSTIAGSLTADNYYLIVDGSGSMTDSSCSDGSNKMNTAKKALQEFVNQIPSKSNIGVYVFDANGEGERLHLSAENNRQAMSTIQGIHAAGGTPLGRSIRVGVQALTQQAQKQLGYGEYHLVVITDGAANSTESLNEAVQFMLTKTPIVLHTIGFCIDESHALNKPGYTLYKSANDPESLRKGLSSVLAEAPNFDLSAFPAEDN